MDEIAFSGSGTNQDIQIEDQGPILPGYVPYLSLVYKLIVTTVILLLSGWVVFTIKITQSLHKPHNIFVANLLMSGMITTLSGCLIACTMITSFQLGIESFVSCFAYKFRLLPIHVNNMSFMIIAADKVFAIKYPFKYRRKMKPRVVTAVIVSVWLLALIPTAQTIIFDASGYNPNVEYGTCLADGTAFLEAVIIFITPLILSPILTVILNIYLAIKAHHVHKQIEKETRLAGTIDSPSERMITLKKKQSSIKRHRKPLITLLVVVLGSSFIGLTFTPLYLLGRFLSWFSSLSRSHGISCCSKHALCSAVTPTTCIWAVLQTSPRANGEALEQDFEDKQDKCSCPTATKDRMDVNMYLLMTVKIIAELYVIIYSSLQCVYCSTTVLLSLNSNNAFTSEN